MDKGLAALMNKDVETAFLVIGYPDGKNEFGDKTVYYWSVNTSSAMILPQTSTTYGTVGTTPVYGTTTYNQIVPMNCNCLIKLIANEDGKLINWEWSGNLCGCETYINKLGRYYDRQNKARKD